MSVLKFPVGFPKVSAGIYLPETQVLVTGHTDGRVAKWSPGRAEPEIIHRCDSTVESMALSSSGRLAVGCHSGYLVNLPLEGMGNPEVLQDGSTSVFSRIWRVLWLDDITLVSAGTYGSLQVWRRTIPQQPAEPLAAHGHSIFGLEGKNSIFASGDYQGVIQVWHKQGSVISAVDQIRTPASIQSMAFGRGNQFATIHQSGRIRIFEKNEDTLKWNEGLTVDTALGEGKCIHITQDGTSLFAGTESHLIQYDFKIQQAQSEPFTEIKSIFSDEKRVYTLTEDGLYAFARSPVEVPLSVVNYQYAKLALVGHTGAGKSTFADWLLGIKKDAYDRTVGKVIVPWIVQKANSHPEKRITIIDHAGQETVIGSFLPFLTDSDFVLVLFNQTEKHSWDRAVELLEDMMPTLDKRTKVVLVRTFVDQHAEVLGPPVAEIRKKLGVAHYFEANPRDGKGMDEIKRNIEMWVDWERSRTMIQSEASQAVESIISQLQREKATVVPIASLKERYKVATSQNITLQHLEFILSSLTSQGIIEFFPNVYNAVIFNDDDYNKLKSQLLIYADSKGGLVSLRELLDNYGPEIYVKVLDELYRRFGVAVKNGDKRIFPGNLSSSKTIIPPDLKTYFKDSKMQSIPLKEGPKDLIPFLNGLEELRLDCVRISQNDGLFAWEENAIVFYTFKDTGDDIGGTKSEVTFYIGGARSETRSRLESEFSRLVKQLYGSKPIDS
ncbi:MAG: hypothetical protein ACLQEQ_04625 [Nitrososphaerales archaeon]